MAWTTPPNFADAAVLTASQLNILSDDLAFLYGLLKASQPSYPSHFFNQNLTSSNNGWVFRYRNRYIHYRVRITDNTIGELHIYVNGTHYTIDTTVRSAGYVYAGYVDVNAQALTVGTVYPVYFTTVAGASGIVEFIIQAEGTTL